MHASSIVRFLRVWSDCREGWNFLNQPHNIVRVALI
jgi:hypothetical protein